MPGLMACREEYGATQAARGRPHHRLAPHDDPDRGAHRDARRARRRGALGELQHLLHPGPRGRRDRRDRRPGVRVEGRVARGVLVVHRAGRALARRRWPQHDPRRRRRRHAADPQGCRVREGGQGSRPGDRRQRGVRGRPRACSADCSGRVSRSSSTRSRPTSRASPRRPPPACTGSTRCTRPARCCSRRSTSTTRSRRASSTTSTAAGTR